MHFGDFTVITVYFQIELVLRKIGAFDHLGKCTTVQRNQKTDHIMMHEAA